MQHELLEYANLVGKAQHLSTEHTAVGIAASALRRCWHDCCTIVAILAPIEVATLMPINNRLAGLPLRVEPVPSVPQYLLALRALHRAAGRDAMGCTTKQKTLGRRQARSLQIDECQLNQNGYGS